MQTDTVLPIARNVIRTLNGVVRTAAICKISHASVCAWDRPKSRKGTGGLVPARHQQRILAYAREHNLPLTPADLIPADPAGEVAA